MTKIYVATTAYDGFLSLHSTLEGAEKVCNDPENHWLEPFVITATLDDPKIYNYD